jgi:hypothetical protein
MNKPPEHALTPNTDLASGTATAVTDAEPTHGVRYVMAAEGDVGSGWITF